MSTLISSNIKPSIDTKKIVFNVEQGGTSYKEMSKITKNVQSTYSVRYPSTGLNLVKDALIDHKTFKDPPTRKMDGSISTRKGINMSAGSRSNAQVLSTVKQDSKNISSGHGGENSIDDKLNEEVQDDNNNEEGSKEKDRYKIDVYNRKADEVIKNLRTFNPKEQLPENFVILICAKRGSGKTFLLKDLLYDFRNDFEKVYLFCKTANLQASVDNDPYDFIPKENITDHFDSAKIEKIMEECENLRLRNNWEDKRNRVNNKVLIILDDLVNDPEVTNSKVLRDIATRGRHSCISLIMLSQILSSRGGFHTSIRNNIDCYISFTIFDKDTKDLVSKCYLSLVDLKLGECLLNKVPQLEPFTCFVMMLRQADNQIHVTKYEDYVFKYKAKTPRHFVMGKKKSMRFTDNLFPTRKRIREVPKGIISGPLVNIEVEDD